MRMDALSKALEEADPRVQGRTEHSAALIMLVSLMGVFACCETWNMIADYAKYHLPLIKRFFPDVEKTPSHDTLRRFFCIVDTKKLENFYREWARSIASALAAATDGSDDSESKAFRHVAIDGKTICGAVNPEALVKESGGRLTLEEAAKYKLHMVSAYLSEEGISLGQERVSVKHNELEAIPKLIDSLTIGKDDVVTIDAMGTHADIAGAISRKKAMYLLEVKDNQKLLKEGIIKVCDCWADCTNPARISRASVEERARGCVTTRECWSCGEPLALGKLGTKWPELRSFGRITMERISIKTGEVYTETHYFISSLPNDAELILKHKRLHWEVENGLHWCLDVNFNEDDDRKRMNSAQNYSLLTKMALAVLKIQKSKVPMNRRRMMLGWSDDAMEQAIWDTIRFFCI